MCVCYSLDVPDRLISNYKLAACRAARLNSRTCAWPFLTSNFPFRLTPIQIVVAIDAIRELCKEVDPACVIEVPEPCQAHIEVSWCTPCLRQGHRSGFCRHACSADECLSGLTIDDSILKHPRNQGEHHFCNLGLECGPSCVDEESPLPPLCGHMHHSHSSRLVKIAHVRNRNGTSNRDLKWKSSGTQANHCCPLWLGTPLAIASLSGSVSRITSCCVNHSMMIGGEHGVVPLDTLLSLPGICPRVSRFQVCP